MSTTERARAPGVLDRECGEKAAGPPLARLGTPCRAVPAVQVFVEPLLSNCLGANPDMRYRDVSRIYRAFGWGLPLALLAAVLGALAHAAVTVALRGGA